MKRIIKIEKCADCPYCGKCKAYKKLTPKQRLSLTIGVGVGDFILKGCHLSEPSNELLEACKMAYKKHHKNDDSIGWDELSNTLYAAICNEVGDDAFCAMNDGYE